MSIVTKAPPVFEASENDVYFLLRDDSMFATDRNVSKFVDDLAELIEKYVPWPVRVFSAKEQVDYTQSFIRDNNIKNVLSLDKWLKGDYNLDISRVFDEKDNQEIPLGYQIAYLHNFEDWLRSVEFVHIFDDDLSSGFTYNTVVSAIDVPTEFTTLNELFGLPNSGDICDVRDWIPNSRFGGLCILEDNNILRRPYIEPFVNLQSRASISNGKEFTIELRGLWSKHGMFY